MNTRERCEATDIFIAEGVVWEANVKHSILSQADDNAKQLLGEGESRWPSEQTISH